MSLIKLANDAIERQHKMAKNTATITGGILGGVYGGALASRKSKTHIAAEHALQKAKEGHIKTTQPGFFKRLFGAEPIKTKIVDNQRVAKLEKTVTRLKRIGKVKTGLGAIVGASMLGAGLRKMQDAQNNYEVALLKGK